MICGVRCFKDEVADVKDHRDRMCMRYHRICGKQSVKVSVFM